MDEIINKQILSREHEEDLKKINWDDIRLNDIIEF